MIAAPSARARADSNQMMLAFLMAMAAMLFAAFTASFIIRKTSADWIAVPMPRILGVTTAILLSCSLAMEAARRRPYRRGMWIGAALGLAVCFAVGQGIAWLQIGRASGFPASNPHRAFLLMLTAVHAAHVGGGILAAIVACRRPHLTGLCATWWHFVGVVWLYLVGILWIL
jgi:cytochrome c oxidase subunit 3